MKEFGSGAYPSSPTVPPSMPLGYSTPQMTSTTKAPMTPEEVEARQEQMREFNLRDVVMALMGVFDSGKSAFDQLVEWALSVLGSFGSIAESIIGFIFGLPGEIIEILTGKEDGDLNDLGTWGLNIRNGIQKTIDAIVKTLFGWIGDLFTLGDAERALKDAAETIAGLSAAVTALQNNQNNVAVGGMSVMIDLTAQSTASTMPGFTHSRSGGGAYGVVQGDGATWSNSANSDATDNFTLGEVTTTDYQKVWVATGSSPRWVNSSNAARLEIHGRKNSSGDTYVFAALEKFKAQIGCVVSGSRTVFATLDDFSFKSGAVYSLECGTLGGLRIFRLLEGNNVIMSVTEVGSTSQAGSGYRHSGGLGFSKWTGLSHCAPSTMWAFAVGDNYPPAVVGSGAQMYRANVDDLVLISSGLSDLTGFFDNIGANTGDISWNLTDSSFTVSRPDWYHVEARLKCANTLWPSHVQLYIKRQSWTTEYTAIGGDGGALSSNAPWGITGGKDIYLDAGDTVSLAYDASSGTGAFEGEASGSECWFSVVSTGNPNRSLVVVE